ncbi:Rv3235 family protein [Planosporangium mesophilum]|uniref:Uncharacterized protein n=1 Tax=Planosporangium mesophilum TaxID=689768 RepID=A0A8J3TF14_9ACTN|nr:Rv3235 family protein [Planosporangium mesophilum]NJC84951.1 hypothetical protein [Planosporangium mesophilum]GII23579.1 hypothetical protein Pme01_31760 [Planosporangium mesophilum]
MTATLTTPGPPRPLVRIRRAPALEPPADDDRSSDDHPVCPGQLALFLSVHGSRDDTGARDGAGARSGTDARKEPGAEDGSAATPPPAHAAVSRFVAACVEVLNGFRPAAHLRPLIPTERFAGVMTQLTRRAVRLRMPGRERIVVRRLRVCEQRAGVAEAVAVLGTGEASWAMALRFEYRGGSWLCTLLEVV